MKRLILIPALLVAIPLQAAVSVITQKKTLVSNYELDSTSMIYCKLADPINVQTKIATSGASTTVTAVIASSAPFALVSAGDVIGVSQNGQFVERTVVSKSDSDTIVVSANITIPAAGQYFWYRSGSCGTGAEDGWIPVEDMDKFDFTIQIDAMGITAGGIDAAVQCRNLSPSTNYATVWSTNYTSTGVDTVLVTALYDQCRVGLKVGTTDDADGAGSGTAEDITVTFRGRLLMRGDW